MATKKIEPVRFAVVGLGHISQVAALPAFGHRRTNCKLRALVSGDAEKRKELGTRYGVPTYDYDQLEECIERESIEAVYLALPNDMHCEFTERAAAVGTHVLCEKPMAVTSDECERMIRAADQARVKLMIGYRLHFEAANLKARAMALGGKLGQVRLFDSTFTMQVRSDNIRVERERGGGPLYDIGIYCIQAARAIFDADPIEAYAMSARGDDARFREVDEAVSAVLRFPGERIATFTCSFGGADVSSYRVVGTDGDLRVEPAYEYVGSLAHHLTLGGRTRRRTFAPRDQFAPELWYFARCVRRNQEPEPSGLEGSIDVQIIEALERSIASGSTVELPEFPRDPAPAADQERRFPPVEKPPVVRASSGSQ